MTRFTFCILVIGLVAAMLSAWISSLWDGQEDAYITYSYAKHIAEGKGFVASVGSKPSLGTTTPLFTLLLASLAYVGIPPHIAGLWIGVFCHGLIAMLLVRLAKEFVNIWLSLAAGIYWSVALAIFFRLGGMETPVFILLIILLALSELHSQASKVSALILALLLLCRPDSLLILTVILAAWILNSRARRYILRNLLLMSIIISPWIIYAAQTFGTIIPASLISKLMVQVSGVVNLESFMREYFPFLMLLPFAVIVCFFGAIHLWSESYELRPFLVWIPLYYFSFLVGEAPDFAWYYVPPLVFVPIIFNRGLMTLIRPVPDAFRFAAMSVAVLIVTTIWIHANLVSTYGLRIPHPQQVHKTFALFLREYSSPQDVIATKEAGMLSYYSDRRVIDLLGLTSPEVLTWSVKQDFEGIILNQKPQFIMIADLDPSHLGYREIKRAPYYMGTYRIYEKISGHQ
jgi:hypothetical protein